MTKSESDRLIYFSVSGDGLPLGWPHGGAVRALSRKSRAWVLAGGKVRLTCPSEDRRMMQQQSVRAAPRNTKDISKMKTVYCSWSTNQSVLCVRSPSQSPRKK